jgi:ribonuclease Y
LAIGWLICRIPAQRRIRAVHQQAQKRIEETKNEAEARAKEIEISLKEEFLKRQKFLERDQGRRKNEIERIERKLQHREDTLDKKFESFERRERSLGDKEKSLENKLRQIERRDAELKAAVEQAQRRCEEISGLTADQAKQMLLESLESEVKQDAASLIRRIESETKEIADKKARQIITLAIQKCASDQVTETTCSVVNLPNDEMKGRIIGREGRNIRALEAATGCNIIVDDTPEAVVLSCFDPLRREVARLALEKLISDGRIHPARIEEIVAKTQKELESDIIETGERACFDLGIHDVHPELIKMLGRLKYRTSYGQNVLNHLSECAHLAGAMAGELGVDAKLAKRAALLHDIGKAVSFETEGPHGAIGAELARKYNESPAVVHAIAAHHGEEEPRTIIAVLVQAADAISAARPGARRETLESYIKRLENLEAIANSFEGVEKCYAIQAGREIRIVVQPERLGENECAKLARDVSKRIETELQYPGQIKVTVLRETRAVEYAK